MFFMIHFAKSFVKQRAIVLLQGKEQIRKT